MKKCNRGLWGDYMLAIFIIAAVTIGYIILQQTYEYNIKPHGVGTGVDATNAGYIELAWDFWPVPVMLGFLFMMIKAGRDKIAGGVGFGDIP